MSQLIRAHIDTDALRGNLGVIRERAAGARVMAVVKANAYGHGLVPTARALPRADAFAVARIEEGVTLREAGIRQPVVLLEGVFSEAQLREAAHHRFEVVVHDPEQLRLLECCTFAHDLVVWLKIDTGMNRLGFRVEQAEAALQRLRSLRFAARELRLLTHLARADERSDPTTVTQIERFRALTGKLGLATSICNSAGIFGWPQRCGDWVRPGLALYGAAPFRGVTGADLRLKPVMTLATTVLATRRVLSGETVGYGGTWRADRDCDVAIVAGGYGDGLPRSLRNGTPVLVEGRRAALVGRVSMDMIAVDVSGLPQVRPGAQCVLWGPGLGVEEVAECAATIPYELLCGVSQRVPLEIA